MSEWQLIETAPKDGLHILVYTPYEPEAGVYVSAYLPNQTEGSGFGSVHSCCGYYQDLNPTHWMPIPKGPE